MQLPYHTRTATHNRKPEGLERTTKTRRIALAISLALSLTTVAVAPVAAAAPNDDPTSATTITSLPASISVDTTEATSGPGDPGYCHAPDFGTDPATVWFEFTATADGPLGATTFGSDYDTTLYVGTPDGEGGIKVIGCSDDTRTLQSAVRFDAQAGQRYLFVVGSSPFGDGLGGNLVFNLDVGPPAQTAAVQLDPIGTVAKGVATFHGTVSCAAPTDLGSLVIVELAQEDGQHYSFGTGFVDVPGCPGKDLEFTIEVASDEGKFKRGPGTVQVIYAACNQYECANETDELVVDLEK